MKDNNNFINFSLQTKIKGFLDAIASQELAQSVKGHFVSFSEEYFLEVESPSITIVFNGLNFFRRIKILNGSNPSISQSVFSSLKVFIASLIL